MDARRFRCPVCNGMDVSVNVEMHDGSVRAQAVCSSCGYRDLAITGGVRDAGIIVDIAAGKAGEFHADYVVDDVLVQELSHDIHELALIACEANRSCSDCPLHGQNSSGRFVAGPLYCEIARGSSEKAYSLITSRYAED